jgi:hypothetical protein
VNPLIVGNPADSHVRSVVNALESLGADPPLVIDAPALQHGGFMLSEAMLEADGGQLPTKGGGRGWLRRYAPSGWGTGIAAGSLESAIHRSFLTLVGSISRSGNRDWLTRIDEMLKAEDRMLQLEIAASVGISVPQTLIASSADRVIEELGDRFVVKPLTLGLYWGPNGPRSVYTSELSRRTARDIDFGGVPFMAQELIDAEQHYRIVTVLDQAWVTSISAAGRPLDWRRQEEAHRDWIETTDDQCGDAALLLSRAMGVGYSSQDWLVRGDRRYFIDLNPGGQWLFLPSRVGESISMAIARFLAAIPE